MNKNVLFKAQRFCTSHFCDASLDDNQFLYKIDQFAYDFNSIEDKIMAIKEVIKIGKSYLNHPAEELLRMEGFNYSTVFMEYSNKELHYR